MSSERKTKSDATQDDPIPTKKQCMDLHFHDDSSVSKFTWEDLSRSSGWENCGTYVGDKSNQAAITESTQTSNMSDKYQIDTEKDSSQTEAGNLTIQNTENRQTIDGCKKEVKMDSSSSSVIISSSSSSSDSSESSIFSIACKSGSSENSSQQGRLYSKCSSESLQSSPSSQTLHCHGTPSASIQSSNSSETIYSQKTPVCSEVCSSPGSLISSSSSSGSSTVSRKLLPNTEADTNTIKDNTYCFPVEDGNPDIKTMVEMEELFGNTDDIDCSDEEYYSSTSYETTSESESENIHDKNSRIIYLKARQARQIKAQQNHVDRESFVMKIMKTFKSNSLYDAFCYTLPRSQEAMNGYKCVVNGILDLSKQCKFGSVQSIINDFPSEQSVDFAECIVEDMRKRYKTLLGEDALNENTNTRHSSENSLSTTLEKEVDNDLPQNIVFMVSDGISDVVSTWSGQFQVSINPVTYIFSLRMFEYNPSFPENTRQVFCQQQLTQEVCKDVMNEMENFECSRQFKMDVDLRSFESLTFTKYSESEGLLFIRMKSRATFYQRLINTSAKDRNNWHEREQFLPFNHRCYQDYVLVLGGVVSELSNIAAQMMKSCPCIEIVNVEISEFVLQHISEDYSWKSRNGEKVTCVENSLKLSIDRRNKILEILVKYGLLQEERHQELVKNVMLTELNLKKGKECNCLDDLEFHPCFKDYINYKCLDVSELEHQLSRRCSITERINKEDIDYDPDTQNVTVAKYLANNTSSDYFSFCSAEMASKDTWHCNICGKCNQENEWHCPKCNKCSKKQLICEHCGLAGHTGYTYIIRPGSVDESTVPRLQWKVQRSTTDLPDWSDSVDNVPEQSDFNMEDFMQDEMGLIDPMAFLLGSEARGGGKRQGRCRQKYEKIVEGNPKMLAAAGCIVQ